MTKVLFISPSTRHLGTALTVYPPLGILYMASVLLKSGYEVKVIDADIDNLSPEDVQAAAESFGPDFVGLTMNTLQSGSAFKIAECLKKQNPDVRIIAGGPHPSALRGEVLRRCPSIDAIIFGEGEEALPELIAAFLDGGDLGRVDGVCFRDGDVIKTNLPRGPISDLDSLPRPALDLAMPIRRYHGAYPIGGRPSIHMMASRGCPFHCTFCSSAVYGKKLRLRSTESVLSEIEWLRDKFQVREIFFQDDTFNFNREWLESLCHGIIERGLNEMVRFKCSFRANEKMVDLNLLKLVKKAGFWMIFYGVESGNQDILNSLKKNLTLAELERAFRLTRKAGIKTYASFMIGNLNETRETVWDTIRFARRLRPDYYGFAVATPYPGTELYEEAKIKGYIRADFDDYDLHRYVMVTEHLGPDEVEALVKEAYDYMSEPEPLSLLDRLRGSIYGTGPGDALECFSPVHDYVPALAAPDLELLGTEVVMGQTDWDVIGPGWYRLERWPAPMRWTGKKATAYLRHPGGSARLNISVVASRAGPVLSIFIDGQKALEQSLAPSEDRIIKLIIDHERSAFRLDLEVDRTWTSSDGDCRDLGVAVNRIWLDNPPVENPPESRLQESIVMGESDWGVLGPGWYELENWPPFMRWTGKVARAYLLRPVDGGVLMASVSPGPGEGQKLTLRIDGRDAGVFSLQPSSPVVLQAPLPGGDGPVSLELEVDRTWVPDPKGDYRELGIAVERIWIEKA